MSVPATSEKPTVEVEEPAAPEKVPAAEKPTKEALTEQGWSAEEIASAEKHGMIGTAKKVEDKAPVVEKKEEPKTEAEKKPEEKPADKKPSTIPGVDVELTPEQEKKFLEVFGPGSAPRGLFFRAKNERKARQNAEARLRELEAENRALKEVGLKPKEAETEDEEDKVLTVRAWKELQERERKERETEEGKNQSKARALLDAQTEQENYAKGVLADFDDVAGLAKDLVQNLEALVTEPYRRQQVVRMMAELRDAAMDADRRDLEGWNAAFIAYEIGKLHPNYGKPKEKTAEAPKTGQEKTGPKSDGGSLTPEQMERVAKNTQRSVSSASVSGGGGKRVVAVEDVTAEQLNAMSYKQRQEFRQKHPERYAQIMRG